MPIAGHQARQVYNQATDIGSCGRMRGGTPTGTPLQTLQQRHRMLVGGQVTCRQGRGGAARCTTGHLHTGGHLAWALGTSGLSRAPLGHSVGRALVPTRTPPAHLPLLPPPPTTLPPPPSSLLPHTFTDSPSRAARTHAHCTHAAPHRYNHMPYRTALTRRDTACARMQHHHSHLLPAPSTTFTHHLHHSAMHAARHHAAWWQHTTAPMPHCLLATPTAGLVSSGSGRRATTRRYHLCTLCLPASFPPALLPPARRPGPYRLRALFCKHAIRTPACLPFKRSCAPPAAASSACLAHGGAPPLSALSAPPPRHGSARCPSTRTSESRGAGGRYTRLGHRQQLTWRLLAGREWQAATLLPARRLKLLQQGARARRWPFEHLDGCLSQTTYYYCFPTALLVAPLPLLFCSTLPVLYLMDASAPPSASYCHMVSVITPPTASPHRATRYHRLHFPACRLPAILPRLRTVLHTLPSPLLTAITTTRKYRLTPRSTLPVNFLPRVRAVLAKHRVTRMRACDTLYARIGHLFHIYRYGRQLMWFGSFIIRGLAARAKATAPTCCLPTACLRTCHKREHTAHMPGARLHA